ncbi:serine protease [Cupriavidus sp. BIC8F]|uniref:serine protease n=1 Tax=Cupriavidus sp. BIC8F TaxID=3079014 RepID=UPI002916B899|nr:serine protease [Cupriavidus sp. BIC8F]
MCAVTAQSRAGVQVLMATALLMSASWSRAAEPLGVPRPLSTREIEVIGGRIVSSGESPWQVALVSSIGTNHVEGVFCGGTLIDSQWVLTAGHCLYDPKNCVQLTRQAFFVAYGSTDLGKKVSLMAPAELRPGKGYSCGSKSNDIALIGLREPVSMSAFVQLPSPAQAATLVVPGARFMTTGWGLTEANGWKSRELLAVEVPVIQYDACKAHYGSVLPAKAICAGEVGKDACTGDSGGPLYQRMTDGRAVQLGIVSFGDSCGKATSPGVYTPVAEYLAWIEEVRKPKPCTAQDIANRIC